MGITFVHQSICLSVNTWFKHFGSESMTWVVFNVQLSYFIHRCRMVRESYLYILQFKGQCHNGTLSTLLFWHDSWRLVCFDKWLSNCSHRCCMVRGRYLYNIRSGIQRSRSYQKSNFHSDRPSAGPFLTLTDFKFDTCHLKLKYCQVGNLAIIKTTIYCA